MEELVGKTTERGWAGLEWAGGLPGSVGGAIRGNAGAFGGEIKDSVVSVTALDAETGKERVWQGADCGFAYRTSHFKTEPQIIWEVRLQFGGGAPAELIRVREEKVAYRKTHHPQGPSVGSIFQNLFIKDLPKGFFEQFPELRDKIRGEKLGAGSLLSELDMNGHRVRGAMVSHEHANIIVNIGAATAADIRQLVSEMKKAVMDHYGIELHEEPQFIQAS
jgi:UDP-N-acetylmuramate dehydrogenase